MVTVIAVGHFRPFLPVLVLVPPWTMVPWSAITWLGQRDVSSSGQGARGNGLKRPTPVTTTTIAMATSDNILLA